MAERAHDEAQHATRGRQWYGYRVAVGCGARALVATIWCLLGATVITIAWNVALAPLAGMARMTFGQGLAIALLGELIVQLMRRKSGEQ